MLHKIKDTALSKCVKLGINFTINEYGKIQILKLDSKQKSLKIEIMLHGENSVLLVNVKNYEIVEVNGKHFIKLYGIDTSRAWINTLCALHLEDKLFELPNKYVKVLKIVI